MKRTTQGSEELLGDGKKTGEKTKVEGSGGALSSHEKSGV